MVGRDGATHSGAHSHSHSEVGRMYNIFRLTGDGLHCLALIVLFAKMNQTRSCAGGCCLGRVALPLLLLLRC